ncbi:hypothetical protein [Methylibium petroleiphilum]|nr:hypothetical protein [Methylibium sp.]
MKKFVSMLIGTVALAVAFPALAGPDWSVIEQARKDKRAQVTPPVALSGPRGCMALLVALPLDHGPRAQTTPDQNRVRRERLAAEYKACVDAAAKSGTQ